jgi:hypothetical protein
MVIADRLRELRAEKSFHKEILRIGRGCCAGTLSGNATNTLQ